MYWKTSIISFVIATIYSAQALAIMPENERLNAAASSIKSGHLQEGATQFKKMADGGCPFSQCILGIMSQKGEGMQKNLNQAIAWYMKSAKQGFPDAENRLGEIYLHGGEGVKSDQRQAAMWFRRAAYHGLVEAQVSLGKLYRHSKLPAEIEESRFWLKKAAAQGSQEAQKLVAELPPVPAVSQNVISPPANIPQVLAKSWSGYSAVVQSLNGAGTQQ